MKFPRITALVRLSLLALISFIAIAIFVPVDITHAQKPGPHWIVRRDGTIVPIQKFSGKKSPSRAPSAEARPLKNERVAEKNLKPAREQSPESIIGPDGRVQVTDTAAYPFSAIAFLEVNFPAGGATCSGWMIGPHTLVTAGHCVYMSGYGGYVTSVTVYPGRNGSTAPYGSYSAVDWYTNSGWVNTQDPKYDYAVVQLSRDIDNLVGYFGYGYNEDNSFFQNRKIKITGFPGDKPYGTMWKMGGRIESVSSTRLFYSIDTYGGQSGSPAYGKWGKNCKPCGFGIHTYGVGGGWTQNSATRITPPIYNFLCTARGGC